jgi:hypothetical protein
MNSNLPLPLELTKPVLLAGDLETQFRTGFSKYDPKTQLCHGGTSSNQESQTTNLINGLAADVQVDVQVDDNDIL